jgi:GGDEF domain-containing protein
MRGDVTLAATTVSLRASIGISWRPDGSPSADELIGEADAAMYASKRLGGGQPSISGPQAQVTESLRS